MLGFLKEPERTNLSLTKGLSKRTNESLTKGLSKCTAPQSFFFSVFFKLQRAFLEVASERIIFWL